MAKERIPHGAGAGAASGQGGTSEAVATRETTSLDVRRTLPALPLVPEATIVEIGEFQVPGSEGIENSWEEAESSFRDMVVFDEDKGGTPPPCGIEGTFDMCRDVSAEVGRQQFIFDITTADGRELGIWGSAVLTARMMKLNPDKGQRIVIVYTGETEQAKKGNPARLFRVWKFKG